MSNPVEEQTVDMTIEYAEEQAALYDAMVRLEENEDFKAIILNGYIKEEALRLVSLLATPVEYANIPKEEVTKDLHGISSFQWWLKNKKQATSSIKQELSEYKQAIIEQEQEESEDV
jgi:hypothetical protein